MRKGSEKRQQEWRLVYMRNMDITRIPSASLQNIWKTLQIDYSKIACASSIGPYLAEFIIKSDYAEQFAQTLTAITIPKELDDSLAIVVDPEYSPLKPYAHIKAHQHCSIPRHVIDVLDRYARESLARRWSSMYYTTENHSVRRFIHSSIESNDLTLLPQVPQSTGKQPILEGKACKASDLVHQRTPNQAGLGKDHLAELIPEPSETRLVVYVDGAYLPDRGTAGIGAYFANSQIPVVAERLQGHQSNARAEVYVMVAVLDRILEHKATAPSSGEIWLCSDSRYAVDGVNVYMETWEQTNWLTAKGKPVANRNAFQALLAAIKRLERKGYNVFVHHLPAHAGIIGNELADMFAKAGALL
ncbi:ribonuclease H-like domain-containing protein [Coemansia spiralis]|nr:ribonuclease H-like domain-containing protein [Coemansia spiralis]